MIDPHECRFCSENPVKAECTVGNGIKTMSMMIGMLFGRMSDDDRLEDGIQLQDGNLLCFDNSSREYVPLGVRIGYCPMCGRELTQKDIEEEE